MILSLMAALWMAQPPLIDSPIRPDVCEIETVTVETRALIPRCDCPEGTQLNIMTLREIEDEAVELTCECCPSALIDATDTPAGRDTTLIAFTAEERRDLENHIRATWLAGPLERRLRFEAFVQTCLDKDFRQLELWSYDMFTWLPPLPDERIAQAESPVRLVNMMDRGPSAPDRVVANHLHLFVTYIHTLVEVAIATDHADHELALFELVDRLVLEYRTGNSRFPSLLRLRAGDHLEQARWNADDLLLRFVLISNEAAGSSTSMWLQEDNRPALRHWRALWEIAALRESDQLRSFQRRNPVDLRQG